MKEIIFSAEGMSCSHCVIAVERALMAMGGVAKAAVSLEKAHVTVQFDETKVSKTNLCQAIEDAGYDMP